MEKCAENRYLKKKKSWKWELYNSGEIYNWSFLSAFYVRFFTKTQGREFCQIIPNYNGKICRKYVGIWKTKKVENERSIIVVKSIIDHFYWHFIDVFQGAKGPQFWEGGHFAGCFLFLSKKYTKLSSKKTTTKNLKITI